MLIKSGFLSNICPEFDIDLANSVIVTLMTSYKWSTQPNDNMQTLQRFVQDYLRDKPYEGIVGVASFQDVYQSALDVQKQYVADRVGKQLEKFQQQGSIISIGVAYHESAIDAINNIRNGVVDYETWNQYSKEYDVLNDLLNNLADALSSEIQGISIPATTSIPTNSVSHVHDYFPTTLSHRLVAEKAGLGWRGKNSLLIHPKFSCALRFTSVITDIVLPHGQSMTSMCGECSACEDVCSFIRYREVLSDYRENCRRYLTYLGRQGITAAVCGKCIQACFRRD
ncbi:MAG: hypothetical protein RTU30_12560 [Candidatus Thorarchaeota archaeon]